MIWRDLAIAVAALIAGTLIAELLGAVDLGTALTFGTIAFIGAIIGSILIRGPRDES